MQQNQEEDGSHLLAPQAISSEPDQHPQHISSSTDTVLEAWVARYNGPGNDHDDASDLAIDASGNVYVTGAEGYEFTVAGDYATIKYDASGVEQWVARYNAPGNRDDNARALAIDASGNVYVTGWSYGSGTSYDYATIKYDASGVEQWVARYNGPGNGDDGAYALAIDASGNVYVTGASGHYYPIFDYATIKYSASGVEQWVARYNGPGNNYDYATALAIDASGNVYVTGWSYGSGTFLDYATIKYDASGVEQWVARYNGPGYSDDYATALAIDASGNVYVTGFSNASASYYDYATIKYDASGVEQWVARYNGPGNSSDYATALAIDASGNVYVTGESEGSGTFNDYATIKYDASGVQQWVARYNGPGNYAFDEATALATDASGNVYVTGYSQDFPFGGDYATIKYDASGVEQWVARYNGPGNFDDSAYALAIDASGNVYVTGYSYGSGISLDYATIKYVQNPSRVVLIGPSDGALINADSVIFSWLPGGPSVDSYWLEYSADSLFVTFFIDSTLTGTTTTIFGLEHDETYWWRVRAHSSYGWGSFSEVWDFTIVTTGIGNEEQLPTVFSLSQNYPNPFNPVTTIRYGLPERSHVRLEVYNLVGQRVATLINGEQQAGWHEVLFEGKTLASGLYFYRIQAGDFVETRKLLLLR